MIHFCIIVHIYHELLETNAYVISKCLSLPVELIHILWCWMFSRYVSVLVSSWSWAYVSRISSRSWPERSRAHLWCLCMNLCWCWCLQDDVEYGMNPLFRNDDSDDDVVGELLLHDSCARTVVYAPKQARYFIVYLFEDFMTFWHQEGHLACGIFLLSSPCSMSVIKHASFL